VWGQKFSGRSEMKEEQEREREWTAEGRKQKKSVHLLTAAAPYNARVYLGQDRFKAHFLDAWKQHKLN
jgi:hypothetical protein